MFLRENGSLTEVRVRILYFSAPDAPSGGGLAFYDLNLVENLPMGRIIRAHPPSFLRC